MNSPPPYRDWQHRHGTEPVAECTATFTLDRQVDEARRRMGERRWAELQQEWVS